MITSHRQSHLTLTHRHFVAPKPHNRSLNWSDTLPPCNMWSHREVRNPNIWQPFWMHVIQTLTLLRLAKQCNRIQVFWQDSAHDHNNHRQANSCVCSNDTLKSNFDGVQEQSKQNQGPANVAADAHATKCPAPNKSISINSEYTLVAASINSEYTLVVTNLSNNECRSQRQRLHMKNWAKIQHLQHERIHVLWNCCLTFWGRLLHSWHLCLCATGWTACVC